MMNWLIPKAHAAQGFEFLKTQTSGGTVDTATLAGKIIDYVLLVAAILAVGYLIYSGILYITAAGNPDAAKKGQQGVINAIIGIVIIVLAYFIARFAAGLGSAVVGASS